MVHINDTGIPFDRQFIGLLGTHKNCKHEYAFRSIKTKQFVEYLLWIDLYKAQCGVLCRREFQSFRPCFKLTCKMPVHMTVCTCISNFNTSVVVKSLCRINGLQLTIEDRVEVLMKYFSNIPPIKLRNSLTDRSFGEPSYSY